MKSIKVLITDDSVVYRSQIRAALSVYPWVEVVATSSNGRLAIERLQQVSVDLLILDLEMPEMDGLQTLTEISKLGISVKTLVFSSASRRGADVTLEALRMGAKDFLTKPGNRGEDPVEQVVCGASDPALAIRALLEPKLRAFFPEHFEPEAKTDSSISTPSVRPTYVKVIWELFRPKCVVIGSSTGGPSALEKIFVQLSAPFGVPVLIAQHMPPVFTASLADRISRLTGMRAKEGAHGETLESNCIYFAPGDYHMTLEGAALNPIIKLDQGPLVNSVRPAVDLLFSSAAKIFREKCLGIVLTGMGHDGKAGSKAIKEAGGGVIIQDRESCVVYGMPGAVEEAGAFDKIATPDEIAAILRSKITQNLGFVQFGGVKNA